MDENVNPEDLPLEDQVAILMSQLPKPVQDFLRSPERDAVSSELSTKYALHADQAGIFERSYIYMLLGVYTPDEFVQELSDAHVPEDAIRGLTTDVNERVFKRLQSAERSPMPTAPFPPPRPAPPTPPAIPILIYVPPPAPPAPPHLSAPSPFSAPPVSMPVPPPLPPQRPVFAKPPAPLPQEHPGVRTMASDMQHLKEESEHPHAPEAPSAWQPATPARTFQTSSVANTASPATHPMPIVPSTPPPNLPGQPAAMNQPLGTLQPIVKEYGVDPYREMPS